MSDNPQDQQTVGPTVPKEPGEIGWPADAAQPVSEAPPPVVIEAEPKPEVVAKPRTKPAESPVE